MSLGMRFLICFEGAELLGWGSWTAIACVCTSDGTANFFLIKPTWCTIFLSMFISFFYVFWATVCPSSGETTVWYAGWNETHSTLHTRQSSIQNNKYQVSHKYRMSEKDCTFFKNFSLGPRCDIRIFYIPKVR